MDEAAGVCGGRGGLWGLKACFVLCSSGMRVDGGRKGGGVVFLPELGKRDAEVFHGSKSRIVAASGGQTDDGGRSGSSCRGSRDGSSIRKNQVADSLELVSR